MESHRKLTVGEMIADIGRMGNRKELVIPNRLKGRTIHNNSISKLITDIEIDIKYSEIGKKIENTRRMLSSALNEDLITLERFDEMTEDLNLFERVVRSNILERKPINSNINVHRLIFGYGATIL